MEDSMHHSLSFRTAAQLRPTGIAIVDEQHRELMSVVRQIQEEQHPLLSHRGRGLILRFCDLQTAHDAVESVLFRVAVSSDGRYPYADTHLHGHSNFLLPLEAIAGEITKGNELGGRDVRRLRLALDIFLAHHTDGSDAAYVKWMEKSRIHPEYVHGLITEVLRTG